MSSPPTQAAQPAQPAQDARSAQVPPAPAANIPPTPSPWRWLNRYQTLGSAFGTALAARPLSGVHWVARNAELARQLGMDEAWLESNEALSIFSGNAPWPDAVAEAQWDFGSGSGFATVYSGHQFGMWAGQLGDGRALLLGEAETALGPQEFQLKGSGPTPYSRMGDGRAVLRSSIREFLASEAMHGLGIPTTRALGLVDSDTSVRREEVETAAAVMRVAPSFIRFGHFEHFSHHGLHAELRQLADFVIANHFPECTQAAQPYAELLGQVALRTADLMAQWQAVGFCHGVMNTDNMSILGLTIDYGPFQFLDGFDPLHICNHSDREGRYAYNRQPNVALWNLYALGQALMPLIGNPDAAHAQLERFREHFPKALRMRMGAKLGLPALTEEEESRVLNPLLRLMASERTDYPIFWRRLSHALPGSPDFTQVADLFLDRAAFNAWASNYAELLQDKDTEALMRDMRRVNPKYVLRNHLAEDAIRAAKQGDFAPVQNLLSVLQSPYEEHPAHEALAGFPPDWARGITISCSS